MPPKVKRSLFKSFLNTGTIMSPTWTLINAGVTTGKVGYSPNITEEIYIHEDTAAISVDSYAPTMPIEASAVKADPVFAYLDTKRKARSVLADAESEVVNVWLYKGAAGGIYLAEKQTVSIQIDDFGGEGGQAAKMNYTINYIGDPSVGTFDPVALEFVETSALALLASLVITGLTLTPVFKAGRIWYKATTEDATNDITAVAENVDDAVIAIDVDGVTVDNGDPATWAEGVNIVTVEVTVDADVATYYVFVTYTPA